MRHVIRAGATLLITGMMVGTLCADEKADKAKAEQLRKEIADLRARLAEKEAELSKLEPPPVIEWKVGAVGVLPQPKGTYFTIFRVVAAGQVIALPTKLVGTVGGGTEEVDAGAPFLVKGIPTAGLQRGSAITLTGRFKVTGEQVLDKPADKGFRGSSVWVIELQK